MALDPDAYLALLGDELAAFGACLADADLDAAVPTCPSWTVADLTLHLGSIHRWALVAMTEGRPDHEPPPGPREPVALREWFAAGAAALVAELAAADPDAGCWTMWPPRTTRFWRRRQALEALVHRHDLDQAVGRRAALPVELCADGVDEVCSGFFPRQVRRGRTSEPGASVQLVASDTGGRWSIGSGPQVGRVIGAAEDLLLLVWRRTSLSDPSLVVSGAEREVAAVLDRPLTP